jgi:dTDP-4-dehydrorhamnose 3,5-epimerase
MHWQAPPHAEDRLVRCTRGSICDVVIDLRKDSPTFTHSLSVTLTADNHTMLYIPAGCAHGFQTLEDMTEVFYQMSVRYVPAAGRGVCWNDPEFRVTWPLPVSVISKRDEQWPGFVTQ